MEKYYEYWMSAIPGQEEEKIRHEINTNYSRNEGLKIIAHPSVGLDNEYYIYYAENYGFDDYLIFARVPNLN